MWGSFIIDPLYEIHGFYILKIVLFLMYVCVIVFLEILPLFCKVATTKNARFLKF